MYLYEIPPGNNVSIAENQVIPATLQNGFVQDSAFSETLVFLIYMFEPEIDLLPYSFNDLPGSLTGSVIGYDQFKILYSLVFIATQDKFQPSGLIVCRYNDRYHRKQR
jgi:hypothetical protein